MPKIRLNMLSWDNCNPLTLIGMGFLDNQMYGWGRNQDEFVFELIPDHFMFKLPENNLK